MERAICARASPLLLHPQPNHGRQRNETLVAELSYCTCLLAGEKKIRGVAQIRGKGRQEGRQGCSINSNKSSDCAVGLRQELPELGGLAMDWHSEGRGSGRETGMQGKRIWGGLQTIINKDQWESNNKPGEGEWRGGRISCRKGEGNQTGAVDAQGKQVA